MTGTTDPARVAQRSSDAAQIAAILALLERILGADVVGAYPHGSAVLGALRPHSDIDVLVIARRPLTPAQRRALTAGLLGLSGSGPLSGARPIELTLVVQSELRPWRYPPSREFLFGEWLRGPLERGEHPAPRGADPDLAPLVAMVLMGDRALVGPPPSEVLDPVPVADVRRAIVAGIPGLLADLEHDTRNVVLTLARIWTTLATGHIRAKDAAADWALPRLPAEHRLVLARARAVYLGDEADRWDDLRSSVAPFVEHVLAEIGRLVPPDR